MKKLILCLVTFLSISFLFNSCSKDEDFDQALLIGEWQSGTVHEIYKSDGTGSTWDSVDTDISQGDKPQAFTWTLVKSDLTQLHIMESSTTKVPKYYTVTELTASSLKYKDSFGVSHSFTKI